MQSALAAVYPPRKLQSAGVGEAKVISDGRERTETM